MRWKITAPDGRVPIYLIYFSACVKLSIVSSKHHIVQLSKSGYKYLSEKNLDQAEKNFRQILSLEPDNSYALVGLGETVRERGDFPGAAEAYLTCLQYHSGNTFALSGLVICYSQTGETDKVIDLWENSFPPGNYRISLLLKVADSYRKTNNFDDAKRMYELVLQREGENIFALNGLGTLHYDIELFDEAMVYWKRQLKKDPRNIRVLTSLGNCCRKNLDFEKGLEYYEKARSIEARNFYTLYGIADCYRGLRDFDQALSAWQEILELDPANGIILTRIGDAYRNLGDYEKAESFYNKALEIGTDIYALLGLAVIRKNTEKPEEAIELLSKVLAQEPGNHRALLALEECEDLLKK